MIIYGLQDPRSQAIRYVGRTKNLRRRMYEHLASARKGSWRYSRCYCANWIKSLIESGVQPQAVILEVCDESTVLLREQVWIASARTGGWSLTNLTDGGDGMLNLDPALRVRMSEQVRQRYEDPAYRQRLIASLTGLKRSAETKAKMSAAHRGPRHHQFGKPTPAEVRAKISAAESGTKNHFYGKRHSAETKRQISQANSGRPSPFKGKKSAHVLPIGCDECQTHVYARGLCRKCHRRAVYHQVVEQFPRMRGGKPGGRPKKT